MNLSLAQAIKFGILVGLAGIFMDASIAHGLWWENDPYWTYWITKTFLITTVFTIGTAFLGIGIRQGLIINFFHTLILEIYYHFLAPIGLPQEPFWLEQRDLWIPGFFVHYLVIFSGYLAALWVWLRAKNRLTLGNPNPRSGILWALLISTAVLIIDGVITHGLLLRDFPGITYYVQHLLISFVFFVAWATFIGFDLRGSFAASLLLSLVWVTYSMYLGPLGLPNALPYYLGYKELWLKSFPGAFISIFIGLLLLTKIMPLSMKNVVKSIIFMLLSVSILVPKPVLAADPNPVGGGMESAASTVGGGMIFVGSNPYDTKSTQEMTGMITISAVDVGNRWSHVQNIDEMKVSAEIISGDTTYRVRIDKAMPRHPWGRYATWMGVAYNHSMHGNTGIGTSKVPEVKPEIALWGYAVVERDGQVISKMAPAHVMVMSKDPIKGIALEVDAEDKALIGAPNGYLHVMWPEIDSLKMPTEERENRETLGWIALIVINVFFLWLVLTENQPVEASSTKTARKKKS